MTHQIPLTVYKASAGSGKTFTLAVEYIKLLIANPMSYRNILAVTFTNKATEEMKMRILSQLNGLAHGYEDSGDYMRKITAEMGVDEKLVQSRAATALSSLIHDYSAFKVETIDKFFQRVLKNLAKELDLTANLRLELNDKQVEQLAVDNMIESLTNQDIVLNWLMSYILENIKEDKSWNIIGQVKKFGENIFKDSYKKHRDELLQILSTPHFFDEFKKELIKLRDESDEELMSIGNRFLEATKGYGMNDFAYGSSGIYNYFCKLRDGNYNGDEPGKRVADCLDSPEKWVKKGAPNRDAIITLVNDTLMGLLEEAESKRRICYRKAKSARVTLSHLNQLRLLGNIEEKVRELNSDANRFLLSDTQGMLHALIDHSDTPFIFEKIGARLRHIMIDEFQDTGALQWSNFKILLDDCMDQGTKNLIVGDVKQSIYRWRSGDWRLLNGITREFHDDDKMIEVKPLGTNYRSSRKVIEFNNSFFSTASQLEYQRLKTVAGDGAEELKKAYSDVSQHIPPFRGDGGYVYVELMGKDKETDDDTVMDRLAETIRALTAQGVAQRDIAILARYNGEIQETAQYFQTHEPSIHIVSDEAFRLDASLAVNIMIMALRVLINERDMLHKAILAKSYQNDILQNGLDDDAILLTTDINDPLTAFKEWLPEGFRSSNQRSALRSLPLTDLMESLYDIFGIEKAKGQSAYICTLYDLVAEYLKDNTSDIERFLQAWEDNYRTKTIHGDDVEGVRMVTIHKSKGLEYDNVIIPFCDWGLEKTRNNTIWCSADEEPFNKLPILPIDYSRTSMIDTAYEEEYKREHLQNTVDNLNLLYVAFTRARHRLIVFGKSSMESEEKKQKKSTSKTSNDAPSNRCLLVEQVLMELAARKEEGHEEQSGETIRDFDLQVCQDGTIVFEYGEFAENAQAKQKKESENIFLQKEDGVGSSIRSYPISAQFRQSNDSRIFTTSEEKELLRLEYIQRGNLLHSIFSRLRTIDDMEDVLRQLEFEGILYDEVSPEDLQRMLKQALASERVREWFSPRWKLHNECAVIFTDPETGQVTSLRPDRVMSDGERTVVIDFKFGRQEREHFRQVSNYMKLLQEMGYKKVEGYLWYVTRNQTVKV